MSQGRLRERVVATGTALWSPDRFGQFLLVGVLGMLVDNAVLAVLVEGWQPPLVLAAIGGKELSITTMFLLNDYWTFAETPVSNQWLGARLVRSHLVRGVGACVGIGVLLALHDWFGIWYVAANIVGIGVGFVFNYVLESTVTWRVHQA